MTHEKAADQVAITEAPEPPLTTLQKLGALLAAEGISDDVRTELPKPLQSAFDLLTNVSRPVSREAALEELDLSITDVLAIQSSLFTRVGRLQMTGKLSEQVQALATESHEELERLAALAPPEATPDAKPRPLKERQRQPRR